METDGQLVLLADVFVERAHFQLLNRVHDHGLGGLLLLVGGRRTCEDEAALHQVELRRDEQLSGNVGIQFLLLLLVRCLLNRIDGWHGWCRPGHGSDMDMATVRRFQVVGTGERERGRGAQGYLRRIQAGAVGDLPAQRKNAL